MGMFKASRCWRDSSRDTGGTAHPCSTWLAAVLQLEVAAAPGDKTGVDSGAGGCAVAGSGASAAGGGEWGGIGVAVLRLIAIVRPNEVDDPRKCHSWVCSTPAACLPEPEPKAAEAASLGKGPGCKVKVSSGQVSRVSQQMRNSPLTHALFGW